MKRFLSLALALAVPAINVGSLLFISGPVQASDPVILESGKSTTFPTWEAGKKTTLCAQNLRKKGTSIKINAGAAQETLELGGKETKCIDRAWGGIRIGVTNQGTALVKVWTS